PRGPVGRARARAPEGTLKIGRTDTGGPVPECSFVGLHRLDVRPQALVVFEIDELDPALPDPIRTAASDGARTIALCDEAFDHIRVLVRDRLVSMACRSCHQNHSGPRSLGRTATSCVQTVEIHFMPQRLLVKECRRYP